MAFDKSSFVVTYASADRVNERSATFNYYCSRIIATRPRARSKLQNRNEWHSLFAFCDHSLKGVELPGKADSYPVLHFRDKTEWRSWLDSNHANVEGVWLKFGKKNSGLVSINYAEALEVALCYGWIDGQSKGLDDQSWLQKFTPRGKRSIWSKVNREKSEALMDAGLMHQAGLAAIEAAKQDGRWERAYDSASRATVPDDLQEALNANKAAKKFFETLTGQNRYSILHRIQTAIKPETRARRIAQFVEMLARGETIYPR
jgi:uncharacterized protein YdeI (YjbR/CyaY-like superfamily)